MNRNQRVTPETSRSPQPRSLKRAAAAATLATVAVLGGPKVLDFFAHKAGQSMDASNPRPDQATLNALEATRNANERRELDENTICIPSQRTMEFTFRAGMGIDAAVLAVKGSGNGPGDVCWDETKADVQHAVDQINQYGQPQIGDTITIQAEEIHQQRQP